MRKCRQKTAFTLVEMVVAFGLLSILMLLMMRLFTGTQNAMENANARNGVYAEARTAYDLVDKMLKSSVGSVYGSATQLKMQVHTPVPFYHGNTELRRVGLVTIFRDTTNNNLLMNFTDDNSGSVSNVILIPRVIELTFRMYSDALNGTQNIPPAESATQSGVLDMSMIQLSPDGYRKYIAATSTEAKTQVKTQFGMRTSRWFKLPSR
ncbi:MAG: prepilin-type N-terminal cleavage/methylation domain-containing protein [Victivallaceae bacterium]|nr:prepilin-type N-terminal cleavage/methylation domain-containing protein [Victivallaceae bacterium]